VADSERQQYIATIAALTATIEGLRADFAKQAEEQAALHEKLDAALRRLYGKKTERRSRPPKMPSPDKALKITPTPAETASVREANREARVLNAVDGGEAEHTVADADKVCPQCGGDADFRPVGLPKTSELFDYVPGYFRRSRHHVETVACRCGKCIVTANGPARATARSKYGAGLAAWIVLQKCSLSLPIYRIEKQLRSQGVPVSRSTLNELFHRVADKLTPIYDVLIEQVRDADIVLADETPLKLMSHDKVAYIWCFLGDGAVVYRFSDNRSATTPIDILGETRGTLLTDGYSGYSPVAKLGGRVRAACLAHIRRKFHEASPTAPQAEVALELILKVYRVEREVRADGLAGTDHHLRLRRQRAGPAMEKLKKWMAERKHDTPPKSPLGAAIMYAQNQWKAATRFLDDPHLPVDNNASERALRVVALGRKNFYGAGSKAGGQALAILYSLAATCDAADVEPFAYLRDVIERVEDEDPSALTPTAWAASRA